MNAKLAIDGGTPVRSEALPPRALIGKEEKAAADRVFDEAIASGEAFGYGGHFEQEYEKAFADFMGGGFADAVNSGTNAVFCALGGLQLEPSSEVIVPSITDPGGVMPVVFVGCVPIAADTDPRSYNISAEQVEPLITDKTRAIIAAHIVGEPVDMDPIMKLADKNNLYVIEDCAQSPGAKYKNRYVGTIGHVAAFSTMFGKHFCTGGQGGIVYTKEEDLHWKARRFADRGKPFNIEAPDNAAAGPKDVLDNVVAGLNCNLDDLSAAIGIEQLKKLPDIIKKRRWIGESIKEALKTRKVVSLGWQVPETECVYWWLRIKLDTEKIKVSKEKFCEALAAEGISVVESYRRIPCEAPWFKNNEVLRKRSPQLKIDNAIKAAAEHFNVEINESYRQKEVDDILAALEKVESAYLR